MIQTGIFSLLTGISAISGLVGTRVYPVTLPENPTLPALSYQIAGGSSLPTFETSGMQRLRVQFEARGATYDDAANLRAVLIAELNGMQAALSDGTTLQNAELIESIDYFDQDPRQFRCGVEFYLHFTFP